jgi:LmbE family N-acetylglucosaminyl deacetylase
VAIATDGRRSKAAASPDEVAFIRKNEATQAAQRLGIDRLEWLGLREGDWQVSELQSLLSELLQRYAPTLVYAPSRIDFHPEHLAVAHALARALDSAAAISGPKPRVRVYQVQVPLTRILTNVVTDVSGVLAQSLAALQEYKSQAGSIECVYRRGRYGAFLHLSPGPVEEFWELSAEQYAELHRSPPTEWGDTFRGLRPFAWTDPLAYLVGNSERQRLLRATGQSELARSTA